MVKRDRVVTMFGALYLLVRRDLNRDRALSIAIIVLSFLLVAISATGFGATLTNQKEYDNRYAQVQAPNGVLMYSPGEYSESYTHALQDHSEVESVRTDEGIEGLISSNTEIELPILVTKKSDDTAISVVKGAFPNNDDEIAIPAVTARALSVGLDDDVTFSSAGTKYTFKVVGITDDLVFGSPIMSIKRAIISPDKASAFRTEVGQRGTSTILSFNVNSSDNRSERALNAKRIIEQTSIGYSANFAYDSDFIRRAYMMVPSIILILLLLVSLIIAFIIGLMLNEMIHGLIRREWRNSGILKTLGWTGSAIQARLVTKLVLLASFGSGLGIIGAIILIPKLARIYLTSNGLTMAGTSTLWPPLVMSLITVLYIAIIAAISTKKVLKLRPRNAIVANTTDIRKGKTYSFPRWLAKRNLFVALAVHDIRCQARRYVTLVLSTGLLMFLTLSLAALWTNFSTARQVSQSLGLNTYDVVATRTFKGVNQSPDQILNELTSTVEKEHGIKFISSMDQVTIQTPAGNLVATVSQRAPDTVKVSKGYSPAGAQQVMIASGLSKAKDLDVGDVINLGVGNNTQRFEISGIYETVNQTGLTLWLPETAYKRLKPNYQPSVYVVDLSDQLDSPDVSSLTTSINRTTNFVSTPGRIATDSLISTVQLVMLSLVVLFIAATVIVATVIALLISYTSVSEEARNLTLYETLGVSRPALIRMYSLRAAIVTALGAAFGVIASHLSGALLLGALLNRAGLHDLTLTIPAWVPWLGCVVLICTTYLTSGLAVFTRPAVDRQTITQE